MNTKAKEYCLIYLVMLLYCFWDMVFFRYILSNGNRNWDYLITDAFLWQFIDGVVMTLIFNYLVQRFPTWHLGKIFMLGILFLSIFVIGKAYGVIWYFHSAERLSLAYIGETGFMLRANLVMSMMYTIYLGVKKYIHQTKELHLLQSQQAEMKIDLLEQQINPHFLFNNLSVLTALVHESPKATHFLEALSNVYRYVITHRSEDFVLLEVELEMASNYIFLMKERFEDQFVFEMDIENETQYAIIPNTLHILLENVFKHNRISHKNPLKLTIYLKEDNIWIENEKREKRFKADSTGLGLANLKGRYQLLMNDTPQIIETPTTFKVGIPLIKNY